MTAAEEQELLLDAMSRWASLTPTARKFLSGLSHRIGGTGRLTPRQIQYLQSLLTTFP